MNQHRPFGLILLCLIFVFSGMSPTSANQTRYIDVVAVTWPGAKAPTVSISAIESAITNEVNPRWRDFTTLVGDTKNRTINFLHGKSLNNSLVISRPMSCEGNGAGSFMTAIQIETYKQLGISDWGTRYLIILVPNSGCIWMGRALIGSNEFPGGVVTLHDSASAFVIAHELGHTLGLGHSNFLRCDSGARDGAWGSDCKAVEYGGTVDAMGNVDVTTPLSTYHQWRMGLLDKEEVKQSWLSESVELTASDVVGSTRAIFLRDGKSTYWVEYRRANSKAAYKPGLVIYRTDPPPATAIVSPNPDDTMFGEISDAVGADVWMLNWDSYTYQRSRAAGSMTLPQGNTATVSSGNISISASSTSSENVVKVNIVRKPDTNPPPTPLLTSNATWIYPGAEILSAGYDDGESAIASFEVKLDEKEISLAASNVEKWTPTYLNPFSAPKTLRVRDLPEGVYALSLRAVDLWGNKSAWSPNVTVSIDRSDPIVTGELTINGIKNGLFETSWKGLSDAGSGLCLTQISNGNDWVTYQSKAKSSPPLTLPATGKLGGTLTVFDCLGNGKSGELSIATAYVGASKARRTGKWTQANDVGEGALRCTGKCSATFTNSGNVGVLVGSGTAQVVIASQKVVDIPNSASNALRIGASINIGKKNQLIRVSGSNFTLVGLAKVDVAIDKIIELDRKPPVDDPSLRESIQLELSKFGFNQSDFTSDWTVLPMARGTTLLDPTLDLCSANYPSESGRVARRQVQVTSSKSKFAFLSTEVVRYRGTKEAEQALSELKARFTECAKNKGGVESSGSFMPYLIVDFPNEVAKKFNSENSLLVRTQIGDNNSPRQLLAFYQYSGENYTGMYLVKNGTIGFTDSEISQWADVANSLRSRMEKTPS